MTSIKISELEHYKNMVKELDKEVMVWVRMHTKLQDEVWALEEKIKELKHDQQDLSVLPSMD